MMTRPLRSRPLFMAHPVVALSFVVALLITSPDSSLQLEEKDSQVDDRELEELYGTDMFPEKFDPFVPDLAPKADESGSEDGADLEGSKISGAGEGGSHVNHDDRVHVPLEEFKRLVDMQKSQMERFDLITEALRKLLDQLGTGLLHTQQLAGPENGRTSHSLQASEGKSLEGVGLPSEAGLAPSTDPTQVNMPDSLGDGLEPEARQAPDRTYVGGMTVAKYTPSWSEHFQFLSAVKVEAEITCLHVLPHEGEEGLSKYVAVGVSTGRVYIFMSHGDLLVEFQTASNLPVTAILSFSVKRNETTILTGHTDGSLLMHKLWETRHSGTLPGDEWFTLSMENVAALSNPSIHSSSNYVAVADQGAVKQRPPLGSIRFLEVYRIGRVRYVLASDSEGNIEVFRDNGTFYGAVKAFSRPLAFLRSPNSQRLLFLTSDGLSSLDLRSLAVRNGPCEGLDGSKATYYTFDATGRSKAYGFTDEGHLLYVALSGDTLHFGCHVRSKGKVNMGNSVAAQGIRGYLLVATPTQVVVYNTTLQVGHSSHSISVGVPRFLFASSVDDISAAFLNGPIQRKMQPVIACNRERLVVLGFGGGYVGLYKSYLPVHRSRNFSSRAWSSPLIIIILMVIGGWYFFGKKRDVSMSMSDFDLALTPSPSGAPGYRRPGMDAPLEALPESRRYTGRPDTFAGSSAAGSYGSGALKYRNSGPEPRFTAQTETTFTGSTLVESSMRNSLEPYFQRKPAESNFLASKPESSYQNPLAESDTYSKRELDLRAVRGSSSLHPRIKRLQEPNSF